MDLYILALAGILFYILISVYDYIVRNPREKLVADLRRKIKWSV